ncbi:hypothetical protein DXG01_012573 [Tephrocybe rancida]|nr:hypothetical protein DXG01_012573 [Tephrocybe rancida]
MFNRLSTSHRVPLAVGFLGITCSTLALWDYVSKPLKPQRSTGSSGSVAPATTASGTAEAEVETPSTITATLPPGPASATGPASTASVPARDAPKAVAATPQLVIAPEISYDEKLPGGQRRYQQARVIVDLDEASPSISVTVKPALKQKADGLYARCARTLRNQRPNDPAAFSVTVGIIPSARVAWSVGNLQKLSRGVAALRSDVYGDKLRRCKTLTVNLPTTDEIARNVDVAFLFLPAATTLAWKSHRYQLPLLFDPTVHALDRPHLTHLTLT